MTPDQILADLRDIHLPEIEAGAITAHLVLWPLVLVLLAALVVAWLIWRRRTLWQRDFTEELKKIEHIAEERGEGEGWAGLAYLLKRLAIQKLGRADVAALSGEPWLRQLDDLTGSDLFTNGPGRGLVTFPYLEHDIDEGAAGRMREDLKATIGELRDRPPRHGVAR